MTMDERLALQDLASNLRGLLQSEGSLTQGEIASETGVDQGLISRIRNGKLKRLTQRIEKVRQYVNMRNLSPPDIPTEVIDCVATYLRAGGSPELLNRQVRILTDACALHASASPKLRKQG